MFELTNLARQTETIREYEHLRYIPIVLLAPVRFSLCGIYVSSADSRATRHTEPSPFELYVTVFVGYTLVNHLTVDPCRSSEVVFG